MNKKEHAKINSDCCSTCVHNSVCCYKQDYLDICKAVSEPAVTKHLGSQGISSKEVTLYDILDEIVTKCKHYRKETPTPRYQDSITTLTNPCDISTSTTAEYIYR